MIAQVPCPLASVTGLVTQSPLVGSTRYSPVVRSPVQSPTPGGKPEPGPNLNEIGSLIFTSPV